LYAAVSPAVALKVTMLLLAIVASFSAAAAADSVGVTKSPAAFATAAVGRFHGTSRGSPVHSAATGMIDPS
jgi:hypothetical protein